MTGRGWVVEPAYRSLSLLLIENLINHPRAELFLTNAITLASAPSFAALGCLKVTVGLWNQSAFWITNHQGFVDPILKCDLARASMNASMISGGNCGIRTRIDYWPSARARYVLDWHFRFALLKNRLWIAAAMDGPRIAACAIFDRRDNVGFGLKRVRLVDFQSIWRTWAPGLKRGNQSPVALGIDGSYPPGRMCIVPIIPG